MRRWMAHGLDGIAALLFPLSLHKWYLVFELGVCGDERLVEIVEYETQGRKHTLCPMH